MQQFEPYVSGDAVAEHLALPRREVLRLTRAGKLTAYWISGRVRKTRRYKISEVEADMDKLRRRPTMNGGSPSGSGQEEDDD